MRRSAEGVPAGPLTPLFDALAHPTLTGRWPGREADATFGPLVAAMRESGFRRACAVGLAGVERYSHGEFAARCADHPELVPVAGLDPHRRDLVAELRRIARFGFRAVKVHPRFSRLDLRGPRLGRVLRAASGEGLVVFLCTYLHAPATERLSDDALAEVGRALAAAPDARVVLVHGGDVSILRWAELVRHDPRLLLELSLTLTKYAGSSVDLDLRFLFREFDRRIAIGTDHPEWSHAEVRSRFEELTRGVAEEKRRNAGHRNLEAFLGLPELAG